MWLSNLLLFMSLPQAVFHKLVKSEVLSIELTELSIVRHFRYLLFQMIQPVCEYNLPPKTATPSCPQGLEYLDCYSCWWVRPLKRECSEYTFKLQLVVKLQFGTSVECWVHVHCYYSQINFWRCPWCNAYFRRKWIRRHEFKSWTWLIAFPIALMPFKKIWILLFSL